MNKESYLNYVMLTEPKEKWSGYVFTYITSKCIDNWRKGFDFIIEHAHHSNNGDDPFYYAYWLTINRHIPTTWTTDLIEKHADEDRARIVASWLVSENIVSSEWYKKIWNDGLENVPLPYTPR